MIRRSFHKYGAKRSSSSDGRSFHSKGERNHYEQNIRLREIAGEISDVKFQTQIELTDAAVIYKPDFVYFEKATNQTIAEEFKGFETPDWRIKRKLYSVYGPYPLRIFTADRRGSLTKEQIIPKTPKLICCHCGQPALKGAR